MGTADNFGMEIMLIVSAQSNNCNYKWIFMGTAENFGLEIMLIVSAQSNNCNYKLGFHVHC
jgi:hypothetical protein